MKKKRILLVYYKLFRPGGVAKVMTNLANELASEGHEVKILLMTANTDTFYPLHPKVKIHYVDMFSHWAWGICEFNVKYLKFIPKIHNINTYISHIGTFLLLKSWLKANHRNYDTIISCWYKLSKLISFIKPARKKTIAWEHISHTVGGIFWNKMLGNRYRYLKSVVATNKAGEIHHKAINPNTTTIYNLMDEYCETIDYIEPGEKKDIISVVARLDHEKNLSEFLDIIHSAKIPDSWQVKIIGNGYQREQLIAKAKNENINVEFLGAQDIEAVYQLLNESKINCLTSTAEALPTILIQAMFCSNALVAYDCKYGPSDIINDKNGFLVPLHDRETFRKKLEYLTQNEGALNELMKSSYQQSKEWKKEKIMQQWEGVL